MGIVNLTDTEMEMDLGVWIDTDLKWSHQCRNAASNVMSVLGIIKRSFKHIDVESFEMLYNTYIRPHHYCVQVWNSYHKEDIECLEKVQRRATKLIRAREDIGLKLDWALEGSFSQRIVDNWNRLPEKAVSASSLSAFMKNLNNWMDRNRR